MYSNHQNEIDEFFYPKLHCKLKMLQTCFPNVMNIDLNTKMAFMKIIILQNLSYGAVAYADKWNHYVRHIINFNNTSCDFSYTQKHFIIPALFVKGKLDHQLKKT
ncbi:hypothetical protein T03_17236 [Trichinella britovi]|uniref:Uncharacterized protein n=1 Tax=Trichinella britovi TaxID=45882 RepID=A0A0V1DBS0_TRIBR|nr:hypothetical protein T03_17236 [Trichinella britovi]KRZ92680.1 hypothetical protein T08_5938 [Trichinella sp. T8]